MFPYDVAMFLYDVATYLHTVATYLHTVATYLHTVATYLHTVATYLHTVATYLHTVATYLHTVATYLHDVVMLRTEGLDRFRGLPSYARFGRSDRTQKRHGTAHKHNNEEGEPVTGDKDPNTHQAHAGYIGSTDNK